MELAKGRICLDCEWIFENRDSCPRCASKAFMWLTLALGSLLQREKAEEGAA